MNPASTRVVPSNDKFQLTDSDLEGCLVEIFKRFRCPVGVTVDEYQQRGKSASGNVVYVVKRKQTTVTPATLYTESIVMEHTHKDPKHIYLAMKAVYDVQHHLVELMITNSQEVIVPRMIIQVLSNIIANYPLLTKFAIKNCYIDHNIVHDFKSMLLYSAITDVCLDDCKLNNANYEVILKAPTVVKNLSLCRCNISDPECKEIAAMLRYTELAENHLVTLNLTSNKIGDEGAKYLANALRTNRHLRYLNLADNVIGDEGAICIFRHLLEFPLTHDENVDRRRRYFLYLKKKQEIYAECINKLNSSSILKREKSKRKLMSHTTLSSREGSYQSHNRPKTVVKKIKRVSQDNTWQNIKAEMMAKDILGPFEDPFGTTSFKIIDDYPFCIGNFTLSYLNLAYNNLTYLSLKILLNVVEHQMIYSTQKLCGLMKVILEGNRLPVKCEELSTIQQILKEHVNSFTNKLKNRIADK
ncbi:unnamed protein product [Spodoptera littoralis]|uniref:Uncharacterized protein n=1 Tax=Spodoptera littoralis TaxID=7109 RepID=A0A9P0IHH9_SPOLI|nr:unnamed protein product [Spodoptera littoralis]CAH1645901.1 unnamed protein product [Spodoptera littoralis]